MDWVSAIFQVRTRFSSTYTIGTAFCIGSGLFLTAFHNVCNNAGRIDFLELCLLDRLAADNSAVGWREVGCELIWHNSDSDIALLRTIDELECPILSLRPSEHVSATECLSRGFPRAGMIENAREPLPVSGILHPRSKSETLLWFELSQGAPRLEDWAGISGAPIINAKTSEVVGIVLSARFAMGDSRYLEASPSQHVIAHKELVQATNTQQPTVRLISKSRLCSLISSGEQFSSLKKKYGHKDWYMAERAELVKYGLLCEGIDENLTETCYQLIDACAEMKHFKWLS